MEEEVQAPSPIKRRRAKASGPITVKWGKQRFHGDLVECHVGGPMVLYAGKKTVYLPLDRPITVIGPAPETTQEAATEQRAEPRMRTEAQTGLWR